MKFKSIKKLIAFFMIVVLMTSQLTLVAYAENNNSEAVLVITGTGVSKEISFTLDQLKALEDGKLIQHYSSINRVGTKKLQMGEGLKLSYLLQTAGAVSGYGKIAFCASDGFKREFTEEQINSVRYYYPSIFEGSENGVTAAETIISYRSAAVTKGGISIDMLQDNEGDTPLQLMLGQLNISDVNNSLFVSSLNKIIVGEERAAAELPESSAYKHISYDGAPYNVDSITSATLTIEGPGVEERQIVTIRQLEGMEAGAFRGTYSEKQDGTILDNTYEGITVDYLLKNIVKLKDNADTITFWDQSLQKIGEFTLEDIAKEDSKGNKMIIAYGVNDVPLVFSSSDPGYDKSKHNDNGCTKLVLNSNQDLDNKSFSVVSKIQVGIKSASGIFEHSYAPYNKPEYLYDTLTIAGEGIGKEVVYSLKDIEALANGKANDIGYEGSYSLQNSANYWNNHVLKGAKLYELLLLSGLSDELPDSTPVQIIAKDGYNVGPFTLADIKDSSQYGLYIKGVSDPVKTGLPVLLSYGSDGYPFVPLNTNEGFVNGVDNNGGPLRVTFGQKSLEDINGPNQIKYVSRIVVGKDVNYATHSYKPFDSLKDHTLAVKVFTFESEVAVKEASFTVSEMEGMTYNKKTAAYAMTRGYYTIKKSYGTLNDFYEGINLWYLLKDVVGLPGIEGTISFKSGNKEAAIIDISELNKVNGYYSEYFNAATGMSGLKPVLAYSKNGYPLAASIYSTGLYKGNNGISINGRKMLVRNFGGPLTVILGQSKERPDGLMAANIDEIVVRLAPDPCSHTVEPYTSYDNSVTIKGDGIKAEVSLKVTAIEQMLDYITKANYYVLNKAGVGETEEYKGIGLYDLLRTTAQLQPNAEKVTLVAEDGYSREFLIQDVMRNNYINELEGTENLKMLLAYGKNNKPLVPSANDAGYDKAAGNSGGPLMLVVGQKEPGDKNSSSFVKNIKEIVVTAGEMTNWSHSTPMYESYLDSPIFRITGSEVSEPVTFTLRELEAIVDGIVRDTYTSSQDVAQFEGIDLRYLIEEVVKLKTGVSKPSKITIYSGSKYSRNVDVNQVWDGVLNTEGEYKKIILGYAREGYPLVPDIGDIGYVKSNNGGPIKLIVEENISMWIKWADVIIVGDGEYEKPEK